MALYPGVAEGREDAMLPRRGAYYRQRVAWRLQTRWRRQTRSHATHLPRGPRTLQRRRQRRSTRHLTHSERQCWRFCRR